MEPMYYCRRQQEVVSDFGGPMRSAISNRRALLRQFGVAVMTAVSGIPVTAEAKRKRKKKRNPAPPSSGWSFFGSFGGGTPGNTESSPPNCVTTSQDGLTALVTDPMNHRVAVWTRQDAESSSWIRQTTFGSAGQQAAEFNSPQGVAMSADGRTAYIADSNNFRISIWSRASNTDSAWSPLATFGADADLGNPYDVAVSSDGLTAWVAEIVNHRISVWTRSDSNSTSWQLQTTFGTSGSGPANLNEPAAVWASTDACTVWVADSKNDRISVWHRPDANGQEWSAQTVFGTGGAGAAQFDAPGGLSVTADGLEIYIADVANNRVSVWSRSNAAKTTWTPKTTIGSFGTVQASLNNPRDAHVLPDGSGLWITDPGNHQVDVWRYIEPN